MDNDELRVKALDAAVSLHVHTDISDTDEMLVTANKILAFLTGTEK